MLMTKLFLWKGAIFFTLPIKSDCLFSHQSNMTVPERVLCENVTPIKLLNHENTHAQNILIYQ